MANVYFVDEKGNAFDHHTQRGDMIMVHGAQNVAIAQAFIREGNHTFETVKSMFCGFCGEHMPCGCAEPSSQTKEHPAEVVTIDFASLERRTVEGVITGRLTRKP